MNISLESKNSILEDTLSPLFGNDFNLARLKFIVLFIPALCKVQNVCFEKLAIAFDTSVSVGSSLRRIQRFMSDFVLDMDLITKIIYSLIPKTDKVRLVLDRTNWKFGNTNINILMLGITYKGVAFPLMFKMLSKFGNSSSDERIELINKYIKLFGKETIDCILADREFIGKDWIDFLNRNCIRYHIRIRENFWIENPRTGNLLKASWLFNRLKINQSEFLYKVWYIKGLACYLSASKILNKDGKPELQIIISFNRPEEAESIYKYRWQIETMFRAMKTSGFNIENTHLTDLERITKLIALVILTFTWSYLTGIEMDKIKPIRRLNNGRLAKSYFKYGLDAIAKTLNISNLNEFKFYCNFLSCT
jgi:hypothetical protein